jgi:chemotaxis protein MotA
MELEEKIKELKNTMLKDRADLVNTQKRLEKERIIERKYAAMSISKLLITPLDHFDLALKHEVNNEENVFLKKGLSMAIDGSEPDTIRDLLEIEMEQTNTRHKVHGNIFNQWGGLAGAMGMVGTLIGLVAMLLNMADPSAIGPSMAVALLTTMYGAIIGNVFGTPIYNILGVRNDEETLVQEMILSGIMSIQSGDAPRVLEAKLLSYLPPADRVSQFD